MAFVYWSQLKSMLIKDQLIRKRHWISSLFEFFLPILLVLLHIWILDDQGTTHLSSSAAPKSKVVRQNSPPLKYSSDVYFSQTFYCNSFGAHIYYTSPNDVASKLLPPKFSACSLRSVSLANDRAVVKAWGDAVDERFRNSNTAVFFHELDVDKGIANYTIGGPTIEYEGPYSEPVLNTYQDYIRTQSVINILMANYPDFASLKEANLEYVYTSKLFNEGNPSHEKETDSNPKPASQSSFQIDTFNFIEAYAFLEIGLIYLASIITRRLIREKVTNSKELLRIMGLSDLVYWISHFINYLSLSIFHATFITIIYSVFSNKNPYGNWSASLFWFNYLITSISNILFTFTFTTVLNRPIIGVLLVIVGRAGLAYLPVAASTSTLKLLYISPKVWSCLLPSGQLHFSIYDMFYFGASVKGVSWSSIFKSVKSPETLVLGYIYLTAVVSWFVYSLLIWYLDAVWPWQSGTPKPWHFPVSSFFNKPIEDIEMNGSTTHDLNGNTNMRYEPEPPLLKPSVQCINLYKSFGSTGGKKFAVNGLNLNILKGQITVLLGHNGAGKTTTMSMITGILKPSAGKVLVNGIDLHQDTVAARRCLALCPQTDLLFEELTVTENLELVTGLRGLSREVKKQLIPLNIERVNLTDKTDTLACNLSGGMRRRLQLALALSTASETLILDEPTSGLDPESRRQLWNLLLELRKDLSILLTTHFMEEADALGDRIVIMSSGEIKCSGSPMFLKHRFGTGNSIRIAKNVSSFNQDSLLDTMKAHFPNAVATNETNEEIVYQLSSGIKSTADLSTATLAQLCDSLDENSNSLGITSYGISVTTLEDVFLKVSEDDGASEQTRVQIEDKLFELNKILGYQRLNGLPLFLQRMRGLLMKRVNYTKRHYKTIGFTIILPVIVLLFTFLAATSTTYSFTPSQQLDYPYPIELNLKSIYGPNAKAVVRATFTNNLPFIKAYNEIMEKAGIEVVNIPASLSLNEYMKTSNQSADEFMRDNIFGLIEDPSKLSGFALWFNPRVALSLPLTIDAWTNALIRLHFNGNQMSKATTTIMAMPNRGTNEPFITSTVSQIVSAIFAPIAFALISCSYFLFPSIEAQNKANLIQRMSGIKAPIFWFSHLVFDFSYHIIVSIIILITITVVDQFIFTSIEAFGSIFLLLLLHGLSSIPLFYIFSLLPMNPDRGFSLLTTISLVCTLVGSALAASLVSFGKIKSLHVLLGDLFPPFAMSFGLSKVYGAVKLHSECSRINACDPGNTVSRRLCCNENSELISFNPFKWSKDGILVEILMLTLDSILYTVILIVLDVNLHRLIYWYDTVKKKLLEAPETQGVVEDEDVIAEKHRVQQLIQSKKIDSEALVVNELSKDFGSFRAVDKINFAVHKAECFGLLGINGAGKTTTFRMLTGDAMVTQGDAFLESYSLRNNLQDFQQSISYCPQFDALIDNLTPQETLTLFARIRGMPEDKVKDNVNYIITSTDLTKFAKTCNQNLSGGNKRKLSLAIASIARPKVMFLDEPTTGVDPASRRKIWSTLMHLRDTSGSSIVLTSHSMDECEALCSRIGIMARGNFKCLGSTQHLKEKFGQGFTLIIKIDQEALKKEDEIDRIKQFIKDEFPSSILRDFHQTILHYHITDTSSRWGDMLRSLDHGKGALMIEDFTLSGTTLEQIFLSFAKES
ncbi:ATP-binding cassette sub-family A member 1-like [Tetranychus urticae]|uniref:ABC transporter domain-containing protein n=1 Tax=Tetranychus urticae TaxID=32264 RepID=T1KMK9_TETUR|nr:ATP-binding cassette sub-family A member 1-like [Tetranychus urticae]